MRRVRNVQDDLLYKALAGGVADEGTQKDAADWIAEYHVAMALLLDHIDFTNGACFMVEPIGGVLPLAILEKAQKIIYHE